MKKRMFEILDEMNVVDGNNNTQMVAVCNSFVSAQSGKSNGTVTMGVPAIIVHQLLTNQDRIPLLIVVDRAEYFKRAEKESQPEQSLPEAFTSQPVSFLLTNALRLPIEQQVALRDALIERTPKEQSFSREEVVELLEGVYHEMSIFKNKKDGKKWVEEFLDKKLNTH